MVEKRTPEREVKKEVVRKRHDSSSGTSSGSSGSSSDSSSGSGSTSSSRSASSSSSGSSRSATPKKVTTKDRPRGDQRRSRSPRPAVAKAERGDKAIIASSRRSPTPERHRRRASPSPRRRDRSGSRGRDRRQRSRSKERRASPVRKATPPPRRLCVRNLSRNVTKEHLSEIFGVYGVLKCFEMPMDRQHTHLGRGYGYVEFEQPEDAEKALKHMDGGQIDGQEITCELTHQPRSTMNGGGRRPLSPIGYRYRGPSPRRYRSPPPPRGGRATGGNLAPLGPSRFNRSRSRSPRRRRSRS